MEKVDAFYQIVLTVSHTQQLLANKRAIESEQTFGLINSGSKI